MIKHNKAELQKNIDSAIERLIDNDYAASTMLRTIIDNKHVTITFSYTKDANPFGHLTHEEYADLLENGIGE